MDHDANHHEMPPPAASDARKPSRVRFSLAAIMFVMTAASLVLGVARVIPMPEEYRRVLLIFGVVWGMIGLFAAGPAALRYFELRRQVHHRKEKLAEWIQEKQRTVNVKRDRSTDNESERGR